MAHFDVLEQVLKELLVAQNADQLQNAHLTRVNLDVVSLSWERIHIQIGNLEALDQEERLRRDRRQTLLKIAQLALLNRPVKCANLAAEAFRLALFLLHHVDEFVGFFHI